MESWDDHRFFLAIARARSLTGAANLLSVSQPTVSRRLEVMERRFKAKLFHRTRNGYELSPSGAELFETVERVEEELIEANRNILGRDHEVAGSLKFTSTETFINGYLGPHLWAFLSENSQIEVNLICTRSPLSLSRGEADLAIRFTDNPPDTLVGRRLTTVAYGIYAARGPQGARFLETERSSWDWIGMQSESFNRMLYGAFAPESRLKHRVDSQAAMHDMVRAGLGVSILPCYVAELDPELIRLNPTPLTDSRFDLWMLYHPDVRRTRRLRLFADFISSQIRADDDLFRGARGNGQG